MNMDVFDNIKSFLDQEMDLYGDGPALEIVAIKKESVDENSDWKNSQSLVELDSLINTCVKCSLATQRNHFVFGEGNPDADIMLVGEAPGADEDRQGKPFVGAAGQLLTKILAAINLSRDEVYICNILKCRPPQNRDPLPEEIISCQPYLKKQIELIKPKFVLCLGRFAAQTLLNTQTSLGVLRGKLHPYGDTNLIVTYHPAALLRNAEYKRPTWEDVQFLQREYVKTKNMSN